MGERVLSPAGLVFKGSGFYITDYGKDGKKAEREAASKPKPDTATPAAEATKKSDTKSDTKPAASATSTEKSAPKESATSPSPKKTTSE
jgi:hypothetical protein